MRTLAEQAAAELADAPVDRLRDLHDRRQAGRRPAQRTLGRDRQDRMRYPYLRHWWQSRSALLTHGG
jgi:hypothetical protein